MSQHHVDAVRRCIEAYLRGDYVAATASLAPEVVWENGQELPAHGPGRGPGHVDALEQRLGDP